jgi:hypothetical protein
VAAGEEVGNVDRVDGVDIADKGNLVKQRGVIRGRRF